MNTCKTPKFYIQATEVKQLETSGMELDVTKADKAIDVKDKDVKDLASEEMTSKVSIFLDKKGHDDGGVCYYFFFVNRLENDRETIGWDAKLTLIPLLHFGDF